MNANQNRSFGGEKLPSPIWHRPTPSISILVLLALASTSFAQAQSGTLGESTANPGTGAPLTITLQDALQRARMNEIGRAHV